MSKGANTGSWRHFVLRAGTVLLIVLMSCSSLSAKLLAQLSKREFDLTSPALRANVLQFYSDLSVPIETKKDTIRWQSVLTELDQLKAAAPEQTVAGSPAQ